MNEDTYVSLSGRFSDAVDAVDRFDFGHGVALVEPPNELLGELKRRMPDETNEANELGIHEDTPYILIEDAEWEEKETDNGPVYVSPRTAANSIFAQPIGQGTSVRVHPDAVLILAAMELVRPFYFSIDFQFGSREGSTEDLFFSYSGGHYLTKSVPLWLSQDQGDPFDLDDLEEAKERFQRIKGLNPSETPRLRRAVNTYARALFIEEWDWLFLNFTILLESLFSFEPYEVTHQISERVATETDIVRDTRPQRYRRMTELYGVRSNIVHGSHAAMNRDAAVSALQDLSRFCRQSLRIALTDEELQKVYKADAEGNRHKAGDILMKRVLHEPDLGETDTG